MNIPNLPHILLWIEALESGNYQQTDGRLAAYDGEQAQYCCLGVACEVYLRENPEQLAAKKLVADENEYSYFGDLTALPGVIYDWFGLPDCDPRIPLGDKNFTLSALNDDQGASFRDIATALRKHYRLPKESRLYEGRVHEDEDFKVEAVTDIDGTWYHVYRQTGEHLDRYPELEEALSTLPLWKEDES